MKFLEHEMKVKMVERRLCRIVIGSEMHVSFSPEKGTLDAVFISTCCLVNSISYACPQLILFLYSNFFFLCHFLINIIK